MRKIKRNIIKCNHCGKVIESKYCHDYQECDCGAVFVDGGHDYLRRGFINDPSDYTDLSELEDEEDGDTMTIYTHDEAAMIVEMFEKVLDKYNISVPSDEDDERDEDNMVGLYGSTYSDLLDDVENALIALLSNHKPGTNVVTDLFSGEF